MKHLALALLCLLSLTSCSESEDAPQQPATKGKKLITIGDSLTACCEWQPWLVEWFGFTWSQSETINGLDGHAPMAVGGTWVKPNYTNSIYIRSLDAKYYDPDIIILYTMSDPSDLWLTKGNKGTTYDEKVAEEIPYRGRAFDPDIRAVSAYMGMIENLQEDCPDAKIYLMGTMPARCEIGMNPTGEFAAMYPSPRFPDMEAVKEFEANERWPKHEFVRAIAKRYGLPFISLWEMSGITDENAAEYYGDVAGDCTQVHPNDKGNRRMAECIRDFLLDEAQAQ